MDLAPAGTIVEGLDEDGHATVAGDRERVGDIAKAGWIVRQPDDRIGLGSRLGHARDGSADKA